MAVTLLWVGPKSISRDLTSGLGLAGSIKLRLRMWHSFDRQIELRLELCYSAAPMETSLPEILSLPADAVPPALVEWLSSHESPALLVSLERLPDGTLVLQSLPDVDPALVSQIRKVLAQHADTLRRLT